LTSIVLIFQARDYSDSYRTILFKINFIADQLVKEIKSFYIA